MTIFDTHCHYNLKPFSEDWQRYWQEAQTHGVKESVVIGVDLESSRLAIDIACQDQNLFAAVGVHPSEFEEKDLANTQSELGTLIEKDRETNNRIVAIGETGLDFFRTETESTKQKQIEAFKVHLSLAEKFALPVIIHVRDKDVTEEPTPGNAYWELAEIVEEELEKGNLKNGFILHCLSGPKAYVKKMTDLGAYCGIAANVTYKNADHLRELAKLVPNDKLLAETDAPFLPPQDFRGKTCEPWMIEKTVQFLEQNLDVHPDQLVKNAQQLFHTLQ